jgi:uncharacterized protein
MKIQLALVAVLGISFAFPLAAAPAVQESDPKSAKERKIRKLLEITGASASGKQVMDAMLDHFSKAGGLPEGFIEKFKETAKPDSLVEIIVPIYMKHLEEEAVDGAIAFFESAPGKMFIKAQPAIVKESMEAGQRWGAEAAQKALKELDK